MTNILAIKQDLVRRTRLRRKEAKLSQAALASRAGVSLGSLKRFEQTGEIALSSFIRIAYVLGYEHDLEQLLTRKNYQSLDEIINAK
ncbi:MAG: helix-turn-helix transcriptional regulator [Candidatus Margulisbacteria bacterium]|jgi:transcriptional regulator with XRE-family HTH domain|nr:helix-turn-helix transcriptional regulator [Candidatus Margulisiibacteriota bacterium]